MRHWSTEWKGYLPEANNEHSPCANDGVEIVTAGKHVPLADWDGTLFEQRSSLMESDNGAFREARVRLRVCPVVPEKSSPLTAFFYVD